MSKENDAAVEVIPDRASPLDPETDDSEASDILELIERNPDAETEMQEKPAPVATDRYAGKEDGSLALESLYFRSFGNRPLLNREEEIAIAKRIDQGSRSVRNALREAQIGRAHV